MNRKDLDRALVETFARPMADLGFGKASRQAEFSSVHDGMTRVISFDAVKWPRAQGWDVRLRVSVRFEPIEQVLNEIDPDRLRASDSTRRSVATVSTLTINLTPPDLAFSAGTPGDICAAVPKVMDHLNGVVPAFFGHFASLDALLTHLKSEQGHLYVSSLQHVLPVALAVSGASAREVKDWVRRLTEKHPGHPSRIFLNRLGERFPSLEIDEAFLESLPRPSG